MKLCHTAVFLPPCCYSITCLQPSPSTLSAPPAAPTPREDSEDAISLTMQLLVDTSRKLTSALVGSALYRVGSHANLSRVGSGANLASLML